MHHRCRRAPADLDVIAHRLAVVYPKNYPKQFSVRVVSWVDSLVGQFRRTLYTLAEVRQRVGEVLPRRLGYVRSAVLEPIESYRERIPDHALLKYDDAVQSGLFDKFWVATPTYYQERQVDPWIVAEVGGADCWAVIARWD